MASPGTEIPAHRACAHCRSQKVRCIASDNDPDLCQRCARSGRPCVFTPVHKRKQRKRTDTRVAELEREMRAMRAALKKKGDTTRASSPPQDTGRGRPLGLWYKALQPNAPRLTQSVWEDVGEDDGLSFISARDEPRAREHLWTRMPDQPKFDPKDVIDKGMVSMATARHLLETYQNDLFPHYPLVAVPSHTTAEEMRREKPVLFLAVIAAAAGKDQSDLSAALDREVLHAYATRSLLRSEKSLELVQALLISAVWYFPPLRFGELRYYEYTSAAVSMAMDIGLGTRPAAQRSRKKSRMRSIHSAEDMQDPSLSMTPRSRDASPDSASIESRRTMLACYLTCASVSISLRRPNMLRVNSYIRECVEFLERSPGALSTDRTLVAWVKLVFIADEISTSFNHDDSGGVASISELRTQLMLRDFSSRLTAWYVNVPEVDMGTGSLAIMFYTIRLYLNEIALHVDHSPEDFRAPFQMSPIRTVPHADNVPTQVLAEAIAELISSSHSLISTFISMAPDKCRALPVFSYVRVSYAAFVLAKLCLSASHPASRIGRVLDRSSIKAESFMDRTILHVRNVVGTYRARVPAIFIALLFKLRQWCINPDLIDQSEEDSPDSQGSPAPIENSGTKASTAVVSALGRQVVSLQRSSRSESPRHGVSGGLFTDGLSQGAETLEAGPIPHHGQVPQPGPSNSGPGLSGNSTPGHAYTASTSAGAAPPAARPYIPGNDQMEVDSSLYPFLEDLNAFSAGGLTGLEDWGGMLPDITQADFGFTQPHTFNGS